MATYLLAFRPVASDVQAIKAALAWIMAIIMAPVRRYRAAALEARLIRYAVQARRNTALAYSVPSGLASLPLPCETPHVIDAAPRAIAPPLCLDAREDVQALPSVQAEAPAPVKAPRKRKPAAPKKEAPAKKTPRKAPAKPKAPAKKAPAAPKARVRKAA